MHDVWFKRNTSKHYQQGRLLSIYRKNKKTRMRVKLETSSESVTCKYIVGFDEILDPECFKRKRHARVLLEETKKFMKYHCDMFLEVADQLSHKKY